MPIDVALAKRAEPAVRFFTWTPPGVSLGWKQPRPQWLNPDAWRSAGLALVERPTGGGLAVHGSDLSVAVVVPRRPDLPLTALMRTVCESAARLCRSYGAPAEPLLDCPGAGRITYCLTEMSSYAVMISGRKAAGFALRRYPESWLIQGSLLVRPVPGGLEQALPSPVRGAYAARAVPLSEAAGRPVRATAAAERWAGEWIWWWNEALSQELSLAHAV
jgi:lipoate-protein ligase A